MNKKDKLYDLVIECQMLEYKTESFLKKTHKENKSIQSDLFKRISIDELVELKKELSNNYDSLVEFSKEEGIDGNLPYSLF